MSISALTLAKPRHKLPGIPLEVSMVPIRTVLRVSSALLVAAAVASPASSWAQSVTRSGDRLTVEAQSLPIGRVLRDMLAVAPIEALMIDPKVENHVVNARLVGVSPAEAINQVLADSNLPFLLWGGARGPWRIYVGDKDAAIRVTAGSPLPPGGPAAGAAGPTPEMVEAKERILDAEKREAEAAEESKRAVSQAQREAEAQPIVIMDDPNVPGGYTMYGESVIYHDPTFVPYKNLPEVQARREATDISQIP
jgi:hypothetical protein